MDQGRNLRASQDGTFPRPKPLLSNQRQQSVANISPSAKTSTWKSPNVQRTPKGGESVLFTIKRRSSTPKDQKAFFTEPYYANDRSSIEAIENWRLENRVCLFFFIYFFCNKKCLLLKI